MPDVVVTVPKRLWREWIAEGDLPGDEWSGLLSYFHIGYRRPDIEPGERVYIVAHGRLRGYAPLYCIDGCEGNYELVRRGDAVAVTVPWVIPGFRGWRYRWWGRESEVPFANWREPTPETLDVGLFATKGGE